VIAGLENDYFFYQRTIQPATNKREFIIIEIRIYNIQCWQIHTIFKSKTSNFT